MSKKSFVTGAYKKPDYEVIIIDDFSKDNSLRVIKNFSMRT